MEKKSIGGFIAALRRASGLTQRQLAERLGVSDKSVSRWERDESAPDLALIPIIAELFGVTSDELLRGERIQRESDAQSSPRRSDRERRRLLSVGLARYKNRSCIAAACAERATPKQKREIRALAEDVERLIRRGIDHTEKDIEFHAAICKYADN